MGKVDLTDLTARTINNVLAVVAQGTYSVRGDKLPLVTQELATLETLSRKLETGELVVVEPIKEDEEQDHDPNSDAT